LPVGDRCGWDGVSKSESVRKPDLQAEETQGARSTASKTIAKTVVFTSTKIQTFSYKIIRVRKEYLLFSHFVFLLHVNTT